MALQDLEQLNLAIDQAVHKDGPMGKTTAAGLNAVLKTLASEIAATPSESTDGVEILSYAEAHIRQAAGTWQPGTFYLLNQRPNPHLGSSSEVLVQANATDALATEAILCTRVPDYANVPLWRTNYFEQGAVTGTTYVQTDLPFVSLAPQETDFVDYSLDGDDSVVITPLPFVFEYGGIACTQVAVDANGRLIMDPAHFNSEYAQHDLAPGYASIYLCWGDLIVNPGTVRYFVTGQAPYRKFVADYTNVIPQTGFPSFSFSGVFSGQIVLEETTNAVTLGFSSNSLTETNWVQGLQYPQQAYQVEQGQAHSSGVLHRFLPVTSHAPVVPALANTATVRWLGRTWTLTSGGNASDEPGTSSAWEPATSTGADAFGNSIPSYDYISYDVLTDSISQRRDSQGNVLKSSSMAGFPWGNPGVRDNYLRAVTLDDSLHHTQDLQFSGNTLVDVSLRNVALAGIRFANNRLTDVALQDYAPSSFEGVEATHGLDPAYTNCSGQQFWQGKPVREASEAASELVRSVLHRQSQAAVAIYKNGQLVSDRVPDFTHPVGSIIPEHDRIDLLGDWSKRTLWLRNYDFTINGNNVAVSGVAVGRGSTGQKTSISNLTVLGALDLNVTRPLTSSLNLNPLASATAGMNITLTRCTIGQLALAPGTSDAGVGTNYYTISYCTIGRIDRTAAGVGTRHRLSHCTFGQDLTTGSVFGGAGPDEVGALVIANSVIYLNGTATLFDNGATPSQQPVFQAVTVVAADGTVSHLNTI